MMFGGAPLNVLKYYPREFKKVFGIQVWKTFRNVWKVLGKFSQYDWTKNVSHN